MTLSEKALRTGASTLAFVTALSPFNALGSGLSASPLITDDGAIITYRPGVYNAVLATGGDRLNGHTFGRALVGALEADLQQPSSDARVVTLPKEYTTKPEPLMGTFVTPSDQAVQGASGTTVVASLCLEKMEKSGQTNDAGQPLLRRSIFLHDITRKGKVIPNTTYKGPREFLQPSSDFAIVKQGADGKKQVIDYKLACQDFINSAKAAFSAAPSRAQNPASPPRSTEAPKTGDKVSQDDGCDRAFAQGIIRKAATSSSEIRMQKQQECLANGYKFRGH
jgi:hypothetical protein